MHELWALVIWNPTFRQRTGAEWIISGQSRSLHLEEVKRIKFFGLALVPCCIAIKENQSTVLCRKHLCDAPGHSYTVVAKPSFEMGMTAPVS